MRFIASPYCFYFISQNTLLKDLLFKVSNGIEPMSPRHKLDGITCWPTSGVGRIFEGYSFPYRKLVIN